MIQSCTAVIHDSVSRTSLKYDERQQHDELMCRRKSKQCFMTDCRSPGDMLFDGPAHRGHSCGSLHRTQRTHSAKSETRNVGSSDFTSMCGSFNPLHHVEKCLPLSTKLTIDTVFRNFAGAAAQQHPTFAREGTRTGSFCGHPAGACV